MQAWRQLFTDFLTKRGVNQPYLDSDYFDYIDGKPRYDGVRALLASRGIQLAEGDPGDSPDLETVCGLGNRKNEFFAAVLRERASSRTPDRSSCLIISLSVAPRLRSSRRLVTRRRCWRPRTWGHGSTSWSMAMSPPRRAFVASRHRIPSSLLLTSSAYRCSVLWCSRMRSLVSKPDMPGASDSSLVWIAASERSD